MATIFKYKDKYYQATNLDKKLKRLKIQSSNIEILYEGDLSQSELERKFLEISKAEKEIEDESWHNPTLYYFFNPKDGTSITSINNIIPPGYERTTKTALENYWNKTRSV